MNIQAKIIELIKESERTQYEYLKSFEKDETKRVAAIASIEQLTEIIKAKREIGELISKQYWAEKESLINVCEKALEKAIELGDSELAYVHIQFINILYLDNPFEKLRKLF